MITSVKIDNDVYLNTCSDKDKCVREASVVVECGNGVSLYLDQDDLFSSTTLANFCMGTSAGYHDRHQNGDNESRTTCLLSGDDGSRIARFSSSFISVSLELNHNNLDYLAQLARLHDWCQVENAIYPAASTKSAPDAFAEVFWPKDPNRFTSNCAQKINIMVEQTINDHRVPADQKHAPTASIKVPAMTQRRCFD
jgi:hypothetical protein